MAKTKTHQNGESLSNDDASQRRPRATPSFAGLSASSAASSRVGKAVSRKRDTAPELLLRRALHKRGLRFRVNVNSLAGRPDVVFTRAALAIFVDGDFWHGRDLDVRLAKLGSGHNAPYWTQKIQANVARDARVSELLAQQGWRALRLWESDLKRSLSTIVDDIEAYVRAHRSSARRLYLTLEKPGLER